MTLTKFNNTVLKAIIIIGCFYSTSIVAQSETKIVNSKQDTIKDNYYVMTFICKSCKEKNKFAISGKETITLKKVKFPLKIKLKPGTYKMTYWQNKVRQIHLPFTVKTDSENHFIVKE